MRKSTVYPTEVETENYLTRRIVKGASFKNGRAKLKSRGSSLSEQSNHGNNFFPMDVKTSGDVDNRRGTWVVDIKDEKGGHWITDNFQKKECIRYVPDSHKPGQPCFCGRTKEQHISIAMNPSDQQSKPWRPSIDLERSPTDAFGKIVFFPCRSGREKPAKYVRLAEDTNPQDIMQLLIHHWRLPRPKLVISVTGGAKNFKLDSQDQETFNRGLIRASQATGAWILTGGTNIGVNKSVGLAVREGQSMKWVRRKAEQAVNCIGIAPWGYIENTDRLVGKNGQGLFPALYNVNPVVMRGKPCPLNPDHTHFILVDSGMKNKYGADLLLRPKIEEAIAAPKSELGQGIPVVLVVLEGGTDALTTTKNAILRGIPTVVCEGTGRAADIIAYAHNHATVVEGVRQLTSFSSIQTLKEKLTAAYDVDPESSKMHALIQDVSICIHQEHLITVFEMDKGENSDMDLAILQALLKGQLASPAQQLSLALSWNRVDVAESKILTDEIVWPDGSFDPFITSALVHNHVEFLKLFLEHGAIMEEYLTVARLRRLYNAADADDHLRILLSKITKNKPHLPVYLHDIGMLLHQLTGSHNDPMYKMDKRVKCVGRGSLALMVLSTSLSGTNLVQKAQEEFVKSEGRDFTTGSNTLSMIELANPGLHFEQPFRELFLWAVLMNRMEMAEFFWERGDNPLSSAIAASRIMHKLASRTSDMDLKQTYKSNARQFESLATSVIEECYQTDEEFAGMLIDCPHPHWQGRNALTIAASANDQEFISHPCCRSVLQSIWLGGLSTSHWCLIVLAIFIPTVIFVLDYKPVTKKKETRPPLWYEKLGIFYKAPITKFWGHLLSYVAFLLMYSYVLLFRFQREPNVLQYVLFGWIATMVLEEIREIVPQPHSNQTFFKKFKKWIRSEWNILDFFMLSFAVIGFTLHMTPKTYGWARTLYAANGCLFFVRLLRTFAVSDSLGPKMVMIKRMMVEMFVFLGIFVVFLVGYGVATQALLYPDQSFSWKAIKNLFYMPYFQIYGELFLDVIVKGECNIDENVESCPKKHPVVPILLGIYLLMGNVLLLNLLIAIFSYIFDDVQTNSLKIWKYELYYLITEIEDRPILPPPMVIIEHLMRTCYWLYKTVTGGCIVDNNKCAKYNESDLRQLHIFEKECAANYRLKKAEKEKAEVPESISRIEKKLEELSKHAESCPASQQKKTSANPKVSPAASRDAIPPSLPPTYAEQQNITSTSPNMRSTQLWGRDIASQSPTRLPPIQESPVMLPRRDSSDALWEEHNEDMDNVIIDHRAIGQDIDGRDRIPPDGVSVNTEKPYRRRSSNSSRQSKPSKSPRKSASHKTPKSKGKSSKHHSDRDSVGTSVSKVSHGSKYSNDPMSDFRLKLLLDAPNEKQQEVAGQSSERSNVSQQEVAGPSSVRSKVGEKNQHSPSSSSSSSSESPRKDQKDASRKLKYGKNDNHNQINMLEGRMSQLEQSSMDTNNALQRIEQLLQLVVQSQPTTDK